MAGAKDNCRIEIWEPGFSAFRSSDSRGKPAGLSAALGEARALSRTSDGPVYVRVNCGKSYAMPRKKKGSTTVARGKSKGRVHGAVFKCSRGRCSFAKGDWSDRLGGK